MIFQKPQKNYTSIINTAHSCVSLAWIWNSWLAPTASNTLSHRHFFLCALYTSRSRALQLIRLPFFFFVFHLCFIFCTRFSICGKYHSIAHKFTSNYSKLTSLYLAYVSYLLVYLLLFSRPAAFFVMKIYIPIHDLIRCSNITICGRNEGTRVETNRKNKNQKS